MFAKRSLVVEAGTVTCPVDGKSDVERCLDCTWLISVERGDGPTTVRCRPLVSRNPYSAIVGVLRPD